MSQAIIRAADIIDTEDFICAEFTAKGLVSTHTGFTYSQLFNSGVRMYDSGDGVNWDMEHDSGQSTLSFLYNGITNVFKLTQSGPRLPTNMSAPYLYTDTNGAIQSGSNSFGSAAFRNSTSITDTVVASVDGSGAITSGNLAVFSDTAGTLANGPSPSTFATPAYVTSLGYITGLSWSGLSGFPPAVSTFSNDSNYATQTYVNSQGFITSAGVTWGGLGGTPPAVSTFSNDVLYVTPTSSTAFSNKTGSISQWTNDSNYATQTYVTSQGYITGTTGFTGSGLFINFNFSNGLCTSAS